MRPAKLLFYTHALVGGGAERVWAQLAAGLAQRGHDVHFAVDRLASHNAHLLPAHMPVHVLGANHASAVKRLASLLHAQRADIALSAVGASNLKLLCAQSLARLMGSPSTALIVSQHGHFSAEHGFLGRLGFRLTWATSRWAHRTLVVSDALRAELISQWGADPAKTVRIYNPIPLPPTEGVPTSAALQARADTILAVGRLVEEKGHHDLLAAFAKTKPSTRLLIAGEGPRMAPLKDQARALCLADRIEFLGYVQDLQPVYGRAKVLVLPSHTEAFGNVIVEALGHGLPVVATDLGGPREILANGRHGRLFPVGDVCAMASAVEHTLASPGDPAPRRARAEEFATGLILDAFELFLADCRSKQRSQDRSPP